MNATMKHAQQSGLTTEKIRELALKFVERTQVGPNPCLRPQPLAEVEKYGTDAGHYEVASMIESALTVLDYFGPYDVPTEDLVEFFRLVVESVDRDHHDDLGRGSSLYKAFIEIAQDR